MLRFISMAALLPFVAGCFGPPEEVDFGDPSLLGPLEDVNLAPEVPAQDGDPFPEMLSMVSGEDEENDRYYAHARAWVKADSAKVWEALRDADVTADRRAVDAWDVVEANALPEFDFSYVVHNEVNDVISVQYDLTWVHELQDGTLDAPQTVAIQWSKTDGTGFINLLSGSVVIERVDSGLCEIQLIEHLRAAARDESTLEAYLEDLYADILAFVNDEPLPAL